MSLRLESASLLMEARLEIGGGAQWGVGIATWDDMSLLESRADVYLYSKFTHLRDGVDLLWSEWQGLLMHTFCIRELLLPGSGGQSMGLEHILVGNHLFSQNTVRFRHVWQRIIQIGNTNAFMIISR